MFSMTAPPPELHAEEVRPALPVDHARRIEELGRIILAYSEVTEKLQQSHDQLMQTVQSLRDELGEKNRQLERRNRLAALGEMAAGLAHEIRNPLGGIQLYASMLQQDLADRPPSQQIACKIGAGVRRLESLVGQVLSFSREMRAQPTLLDLPAIIEQAVDDAAPTLRQNKVRCTVDGPRPLHVHADALLLGQVVLNLVLNSAQAMEDGGTLTVHFSKPPHDSEAKQFHLVVRDQGPGIPANILDRIFNPFFTTKDSGTGLGLAIVHRIVEAHDGAITASNDAAGGARFEIRI